MDRARRVKLLLWSVVGVAAAVGLTRFARGLGATTALTDAVPWGLWIGFDVMGGVAMAAGGFVVTAFYYIFKRDDFHPLVRPAVLTAFLGYLAVIFGLMFDLGLPWNIWHMVIFWNPHSPLFEVGWCVMLYTTVLLMEFLPVPLEAAGRWANIRRSLQKVRLLLVITGIALSTLHQSSLGSLFLIMPYRVHPLWYSSILPILFFLSAISLGFLMATLESLFTGHIYRRKPEREVLGRVGSVVRWVLLIYLIVRLGDLMAQGKSNYLFAGGWRTWWFWVEIALSAVVPSVLLFWPRIRYRTAGQWVIALTGVTGIMLNRINVGGFTHLNRGAHFYLPAWSEIIISAGVVAVMMLVFMFIVEHFRIWERRPADPESDPLTKPVFDPAGRGWLGTPAVASRTKYSLAFVIFAGLGFALLAGRKVEGGGISQVAAQSARGGDTLWVDGNRDGYGVAFPHTAHRQREGDDGCITCHHFDLPDDHGTRCARCHSLMYTASPQYRHDWHSSPAGADLGCFECHSRRETKSADSARKCGECHEVLKTSTVVQVDDFGQVGYVEALHRTCIKCHLSRADSLGKPDLWRCATCHETEPPGNGERRWRAPSVRVIVPDLRDSKPTVQ